MNFTFFFPGQGSQSVGMLHEFGNHVLIKETFTEASDILGQDFWHMATEPNTDLNQTVNTQPLMLAAGVAIWRFWNKAGAPQPAVAAGHSLGEYTALVAAGVLSYQDALPLVKYRAEVMQDAVAADVGAMAAILGLNDEDVQSVCVEAAQKQVLAAVNLNSPGQVVIAGHKAAVERGMALARSKGAKRALLLPVSVPSHCALMKPAADELARYLEDVVLKSGKFPVIHNADVAAHDDAAAVKDALVRQLYSPVRWVETVRHIHAQGIVAGAECGPGKVLTGLARRIVSEFSCIALNGPEAVAAVRQQFSQ